MQTTTATQESGVEILLQGPVESPRIVQSPKRIRTAVNRRDEAGAAVPGSGTGYHGVRV